MRKVVIRLSSLLLGVLAFSGALASCSSGGSNSSESGDAGLEDSVLVAAELPVAMEAEIEPDITTGVLDGHEWVDLGLSVRWATCNVGANSPEDYGEYYAWGEISTKVEYLMENSETGKKRDIGDIGGTIRDVARQKWGASWRMPTRNEFRELETNCDWTWTKDGYKVTSKINGNSIYIPAAGCMTGTSLYRGDYSGGEKGYYWSSNPYIEGSSSYSSYAQGFCFDCINIYIDKELRYEGFSVRPVAEFEGSNSVLEGVEQNPAAEIIDGHDCVDLGLSVKWATTNIGAERVTAYGDYYSWGDIKTQSEYYHSDTYGKIEILDIAGTKYDVDRQKWGGSWRIPTEEEFLELNEKCDFEWMTQGGCNGYKVTSKINGRFIFLPAAGIYGGSSLALDAKGCCYWSSTSSNDGYSAYYYRLYNGQGNMSVTSRGDGIPVRPVCD